MATNKTNAIPTWNEVQTEISKNTISVIDQGEIENSMVSYDIVEYFLTELYKNGLFLFEAKAYDTTGVYLPEIAACLVYVNNNISGTRTITVLYGDAECNIDNGKLIVPDSWFDYIKYRISLIKEGIE